MVLGFTLAGGAAVGSWLWGYNRENFKYDREMRQKNEFKVLEFRNVQAQLWREDIRDIIGLTEKKMDSYLIVSVLQLDACIGLFTEGRLEPGTPPWLLHFYMMTLGAAFMYLLMSVWFAMHASVVAQCSSVRLLTQFVRLPVPTWEELEQMRTYAASFESVHPAHWLRVPFTRSMAPHGDGYAQVHHVQPFAAEDRESPSTACEPKTTPARTAGAKPASHADPWGLEEHGHRRTIYELQEEPPDIRRHIALARKASAQYQCFDAFARVGMTFGTNQFLNAIAYYALGYVAVQDGASWPAWCVVVMMGSMAMAMVHVDFSLTRCEQFTSRFLIFLTLLTSSSATFLFIIEHEKAAALLPMVLPVIYVGHAAWLFTALRSCGIVEQENGAWLPMNFRAVLYLDVFGWNARREASSEQEQELRLQHKQQSDSEAGRKKGNKIKFQAEAKEDAIQGHTEGLEHNRWTGPSGQIQDAPHEAFHPRSYTPHHGTDRSANLDDNVVTGHDRIQPGRLAAMVFRNATWLLIALWLASVGTQSPVASVLSESTGKPLVADIFVEDREGQDQDDALGYGTAQGMNAIVGEDPSGLPELIPVIDNPEMLPEFPGEPEPIKVRWPTHASFVPRALASSTNRWGTMIVVADDFNAYAALLGFEDAGSVSRNLRGLQDVSHELTIKFKPGRACAALEGMAFKDISVVCTNLSASSCRLLVLTEHGQLLTECPLPQGSSKEPFDSVTNSRVLRQPSHTWEVSQDWLRGSRHETVESVALNEACIQEGPGSNETSHLFDPRGSGCAMVGTSCGRIVQLREAQANHTRLIPDRVMHQRAHPSSRGALTIIDGRYILAVWTKYSSISAFDAKQGTVVKEWRLPTHVQWLLVSGDAEHLFLLGVHAERNVEIYRFQLPPELKTRRLQRSTLRPFLPG